MDAMNTRIEMVEVAARDGLQNEPGFFPTADKLELIARAIAAGSKRIEVASFVHPGRVPQMADAEAVCAGLPKRDPKDVTYIGLVLNKRGALRALETQVHELGAVISASDGFGIAQSGPHVGRDGRGCHRDHPPRQGTRPLGAGDDLRRLRLPVRWRDRAIARGGSRAQGCGGGPARDRIWATRSASPCPIQVKTVMAAVKAAAPGIPIRLHFHDTRNTAVANAWAGVEAGATTLDASIGGIGGCPFAPNATGNVATEDVQYMLQRSGVETGL